MAITSKILKKLSVRDGYDIYANFTDSVTEKVKMKVFYYPYDHVPTDQELSGKLTHIASNVQDMINQEEFSKNHPPMDREQIEEILREKELLGTNEYIEDLKTKDELING